MVRRKTKRSSAASEGIHNHIQIRVTGFDTTVSAEVNHDVYIPEHAWLSGEDDPLYSFRTSLEIEGTILNPKDRSGHSCRISIIAMTAPAAASSHRSRASSKGTSTAPHAIGCTGAGRFPFISPQRAWPYSTRSGENLDGQRGSARSPHSSPTRSPSLVSVGLSISQSTSTGSTDGAGSGNCDCRPSYRKWDKTFAVRNLVRTALSAYQSR